VVGATQAAVNRCDPNAERDEDDPVANQHVASASHTPDQRIELAAHRNTNYASARGALCQPLADAHALLVR
jgi:hypothetical protein